MPRPIDSLELFYAHALAIGREAIERYEEFRGYFRDRGEEVLAGLCENMVREEQEHLRRLTRASKNLDLPPIDAGRYHWLDSGSPRRLRWSGGAARPQPNFSTKTRRAVPTESVAPFSASFVRARVSAPRGPRTVRVPA